MRQPAVYALGPKPCSRLASAAANLEDLWNDYWTTRARRSRSCDVKITLAVGRAADRQQADDGAVVRPDSRTFRLSSPRSSGAAPDRCRARRQGEYKRRRARRA